MKQVDSVWAPGETRPMCVQVACREGSGPLPYLRLTVKAMIHQGAGILGPDTRRPYPLTGAATSAYAMRCKLPAPTDRGVIQAQFGGKAGWQPRYGVILNGPLRGVWECRACGWWIDDMDPDVRRGILTKLFQPQVKAGAVKARRR